MAHQLTMRTDGTAEMAYAHGTSVPWHGLGQVVPSNSDIPTWKRLAGMDWTIESVAPFIEVDGMRHEIEDRRVLFRSDNTKPLGFVSKDFNIVQPGEVLDFFHDLVQGIGLELDTAGTLFGGRRFWALAKIGEKALVTGDNIRAHVLLTTACDGTMSTIAKMVSERVVCQNTLSIALGEDGTTVKIPHSTMFSADAVKDRLGMMPNSFNTFMDSIAMLAEKRISVVKATHLTKELFGEGKRAVNKTLDLFSGAAIGYDRPGFKRTAWGWLNCVTEAIDHHGRKKVSPSHDFDYLLVGAGDQIKSRAFEMAMAL